jgi:hypothetical protein
MPADIAKSITIAITHPMPIIKDKKTRFAFIVSSLRFHIVVKPKELESATLALFYYRRGKLSRGNTYQTREAVPNLP